ncbi:MAG: NAD(P)/FAD-dependent oxidoreductase [Alphaproteobacteria bacterium]|jgi:L-2-hydroxyglutarate oxidase LhgO|nr:NAD(P)/FAD-dependent oxidoreductase [Alphaproteobacteria bacterium]MDP6563808.1 NAD(P)/FAD-dependent oxidoreductase [Alphaproteobacteria bacterium]MDP6811755.1 NAD(P)/FAD-dependent oxidoreductase [Alphaproteobacteria bacterium]
MSERIDSIVVGAGVVGLACARALAMAGDEVIVLEAAEAIGTETSSRNSEVIHAGIYYAKDSLKARLCVAGKWQLYDYCASHGVPHRDCGKFIVATNAEELSVLDGIRAKARDNGVDDLYEIDAAEAKRREPALACAGALVSPSTGIVDSHALMLAYQGEAEDHGATIAFRSRALRGEVRPNGFALTVADDGGGETTVGCRRLVNAAGLHAQPLARAIVGLPAAAVPPLYFCKGNYFSLSGRQPFSHLIYPVPASASLGVHLTIDLAGQARFGPDQEWIEGIDYEVDPRRADDFYAAVRRYYPALPDGALQPAYAGIRPKIQAPDGAVEDFKIQGPAAHGIAGLVNLYGIESPGLTASLAIAGQVAELLRD